MVESFSMSIVQPTSMHLFPPTPQIPRAIDVGGRRVECRASISAFVPLTAMVCDREFPLDVVARIQRAVAVGLPSGEVTDVSHDHGHSDRIGTNVSCGIRFLLPPSFGGTHEALLTFLRDTLAAESIDMVCGPILPPAA